MSHTSQRFIDELLAHHEKLRKKLLGQQVVSTAPLLIWHKYGEFTTTISSTQKRGTHVACGPVHSILMAIMEERRCKVCLSTSFIIYRFKKRSPKTSIAISSATLQGKSKQIMTRLLAQHKAFKVLLRACGFFADTRVV